jgi:mannose-6-phosphate isomerase-like protein (cupin superfamily)
MSDRSATAVVTGAAMGTGLEIARRLVTDGVSVVGTDVKANALDEARAELGDGFEPLVGDVGDWDTLSASNPFPADLVEVERGSPLSSVSRTSEVVYLVVSGRCQVRVGRLAGNLEPGDQVHALRDLEHEISSLTE